MDTEDISGIQSCSCPFVTLERFADYTRSSHRTMTSEDDPRLIAPEDYTRILHRKLTPDDDPRRLGLHQNVEPEDYAKVPSYMYTSC